ncbi:MAG TPA: BamA/TamA family outer membrane protein [Gemmatimonadaceae bacterium]|nr:BamA/TamA family outer membrane protein [Gemmatimonadaceae bacterium]
MFSLVALAFIVLVQQGSPPQADSARQAADTGRSERSERRVVPLTPALLASAFRDAHARAVIDRARAERVRQDSSITSYDATTRQRMSVGIRLHEHGRDRMLFRSENASRVRWRRGAGALVDVLGSRTAAPAFFPGVKALTGTMQTSPIPYFPGREGLLFISSRSVARTDEGFFIHPLAADAEAYYTFASGDSASFTLPGGKVVRLVEIEVRAREPKPDVIVGSLWFDEASGHIVRAAYRPAVPLDIVQMAKEEDPHEFDDVPRLMRPLIMPMEFQVRAVTVEYGLHEAHWWLPRSETVEGQMRLGAVRSPFSMAETFAYTSVNGADSLAALPSPDSLFRRQQQLAEERAAGDSAGTRSSRRGARDDSTRTHVTIEVSDDGFDIDVGDEGGGERAGGDLSKRRCSPSDTLIFVRRRFDDALPVAVRVPCDPGKLLASPELPGSIYDSGEETFGLAEREALEKELRGTLQPGWSPEPVHWLTGLENGMWRYNRIEGLSGGIATEQILGEGLSWRAEGRLGVADLEPNGEIHLSRAGMRQTLSLGVYRRLVAASDWENPLGLGNSIDALLFARDNGFYYRGWGAELTGAFSGASAFTWRLFAEEERRATVQSQFSLPNVMNDVRFLPNIVAQRAREMGASFRITPSFGLDPRGFRLAADLRGEGAAGDFDYTRGALDLTVAHPVGARLEASVTAGAGMSGGTVPPQRLWYLGGPHTIRGFDPGEGAGNAYWMTRTELGRQYRAVRPSLFFDLGWAGDRRDWWHPGQPLSSAGAGLSVLDGLLRFDVAKTIHPDRGFRAELYAEGRF